MAWANKAKVSTETPRGRLLTPDLCQILVGAAENLILIFQAETSLWGNESKTDLSGAWSNKSKIAS